MCAWPNSTRPKNSDSSSSRTVQFDQFEQTTRMLRLPLRSARFAIGQSNSSHRLLVKMSTQAYILPVDPKAPGTQSEVSGLDTAKLWSTLPSSKKTPKVGTTRVFYDTPSGGSNLTALVSLGDDYAGKKGDAKRETVRKAIGSAVKDVKNLVESDTAVAVDASADPQAAGEHDCLFPRRTSAHITWNSRCCSSSAVQVYFKDRSAVCFQAWSKRRYSGSSQIWAYKRLAGMGCWCHCCQSAEPSTDCKFRPPVSSKFTLRVFTAYGITGKYADTNGKHCLHTLYSLILTIGIRNKNHRPSPNEWNPNFQILKTWRSLFVMKVRIHKPKFTSHMHPHFFFLFQAWAAEKGMVSLFPLSPSMIEKDLNLPL